MTPTAAESTQPSESTRALRNKHAHAGVAMAAATFAMAGTSGIQALLYLNSFGVDGRTDGFFVAFALYTIFGVFSQSIRVTSAPLLVGDKPRLAPREFAATLLLIAAPVALATTVFAGPLAAILTPGLEPAERAVTEDALPILGLATILQLWAAGGATILAVRDRFKTVAAAYIAGALCGLATYLAVSGSADELSLGWSMLAMAIVTLALMLVGLRGSAAPDAAPSWSWSPAKLAAKAALILGRTGVYLAFNTLFMITLAFASNYAEGDATVLSYAYLFASYLVTGTAFALGLARIADMRRADLSDQRDLIDETVPQGFRYSLVVVAPALAALVAFLASLIGEVLPASFKAHDVATLRTFGALLALWTVGALLVNLLLPAMFALNKARVVNLLAIPLVVLHIAATAVGGALFGIEGVVGAACIAPLAFAAALLSQAAGAQRWTLAWILARDGLRIAVPAIAWFALGAAIGELVGGGFGGHLLAAAIGAVGFAATLRFAAPRQARVLAGGLRPLASEQ